MPPTPRTSGRYSRALALLGLVVLLAGPLAMSSVLARSAAAADPGPGRRVPPELVGAYCPPGGCPDNTLGSAAAFATAVACVTLLARRHN